MKEIQTKGKNKKAKEKAKFIQNHWGKSNFSVLNLGLFFQSYCLPIQLPAKAVAME